MFKKTSHFYIYIISALTNSTEHFVLNGNKVVNTARRTIHIGGTKFEYSGSDSVIEQINSTGPIKQNVSVYVSFVSNKTSQSM